MPVPVYDVSLETVETLFQLGDFMPAGVQRTFEWDENNWSQLLDDLQTSLADSAVWTSEDFASTSEQEADDQDGPVELAAAPDWGHQPAYFLGQIVVMPRADAPLEVYDGMQRITSLTLLACVLRDMISDVEIIRRLNNMIMNSALAPRLIYPGKDRALRQMAQNMGATRVAHEKAGGTNFGASVKKGVAFMRGRLENDSEEALCDLANYLLEATRVTVLRVNSSQLARQIFVTTNKRGRMLADEDLFGGQLADYCQNDAEADQVLAEFRAIRARLGGGFRPFIETVAIIETGFFSSAGAITDLAAALEEQKLSPRSWISQLEARAQAWELMIAIQNDIERDPTNGHIWRLHLLKLKEWQPLCLVWLDDYLRRARSNPQKQKDYLSVLSRRIQRLSRSFCALTAAEATRGERVEVVTRALNDIREKRDPLRRALLLREKLRRRANLNLRQQINNSNTRISLLRWYEAHLAGKQVKKLADQIARSTVEHVLPQRINGVIEWEEAFPDPTRRNALINMIGNLAACPQEVNGEIGREPFKQKVKLLKPHRKTHKTLDSVVREKAWSPLVIEARTELIANALWKEMALPD